MIKRFFCTLVCILPAVLFFSYYPLIHFGSSESMNFEISVPLIWLVVFDVVAVVLLIQKKLFRGAIRKWLWILFPVWLTISVLWSLNMVRGILTVGILWLLYIAVYAMWEMRGILKESVREKFWRVFWGMGLVISAWCLMQCVLDLVGVPRDYSLMCAGCTYASFGFPHPNGMAIEPQFMGNLLLAPAIVAGYLMCSRQSHLKDREGRKYWWLFLVFSATLFLTFSRGAIYAFVVAMVVMAVWMMVREKTKRKEAAKRIGKMCGVIILAFVLILNVQGVMAAVSPTNDTYQSGVAKVLNHLSLGVIDVRGGEGGELSGDEVNGDWSNSDEVANEDVVEDNVAEDEDVIRDGNTEAAFDGYVAESTDTRLRLSGAAIEVWSQDFATAMFGVGLGGAGQALYNNGLSPAPKEIVQNQYMSLLLETGLVGVLLLVLTLVLVVRSVWRSPVRIMIITLLVAYSITLCFFSGLPNALQIYLMPVALVVMSRKEHCF